MSCKSSTQIPTTNPTMKVEYIILSNIAKEVVWLKKFLIDLGVVPTILDPISLDMRHYLMLSLD